MRAAQVDVERLGGAIWIASPVDPNKLAPAPPVPQHSRTVEWRRRRGVVDVVEFVGNAELEANSGVAAAGHGSGHHGVGRQRTTTAIPSQVQHGHFLVLPNPVLIQFERLATAIFLDQFHIVDVEAPVGDLVRTGLPDAHVAVGIPTSEILPVDLGLKFNDGAALPWTVITIAAATGQQSQRDAQRRGVSNRKQQPVVARMGHAGFSWDRVSSGMSHEGPAALV